MADNTEEVTQTSQGTPPAEGQESQPEDQAQENQAQESQEGDKGGEEQPEHSGENQQGNAEDQSGQQEAKLSRAERRVTQLLSKLQASQKRLADQAEQSGGQATQGLFTQEELDEGIDPEVLEQRIDQRVHQTLEMNRINQQYESAVKDNLADLESVGELDQNVEELAVRQYEALNYQQNPLTGERMFIPAVKMSEIVQKITETVRKTAENIAATNREYSANVSQNQAVNGNASLNGAKSVQASTTNFAEFEKTYAPRA